jgi:ribonucleoside-diphosphate reductase alpha chain
MTDGKSAVQQRPEKGEAKTQTRGEGLKFKRVFTKPGVHPFDEIKWEKRDAVITDSKGKVVFEQKGVEVPSFWSQTATNIAVSKYFRGRLGYPERETSARQLIGRVADTMTKWGREGNYFASEEDAEVYHAELTHILVNQWAAFNSPVWFNVGIEAKPQCHACFILSVEDDMDSISGNVGIESRIFKWGSGVGVNLSALRSSKEHVRGGGFASGPLSFLKVYDQNADIIKSGGKTRRAACMRILNVDHPDILEFIEAKAHEEKKAHALIDAGYDGSIAGEAYGTVRFQNANHSIRVTDEFMQAYVDDKEWTTRKVTTGEPFETLKAREVMRRMAQAAWECADPGIQFDTTINNWHTCPNSGRINSSNPCSEYMHLDNSACNLASINLLKLRTADGGFDVELYRHITRVILTAQEVLIDNASYPAEKIEKNAKDFRQLGIGYANLGALLMSYGLAYDSEEARNCAAALTALLTGEGYRQSALMAKRVGPYNGYAVNREPQLKVIQMHREHAYKIQPQGVPKGLLEASLQAWDEALELGTQHGVRNSQISVLAPTGTIAFLMDCDTTGIEPDLALVKYKWLVGGGMLKLVNQTVPQALKVLGYGEAQAQQIIEYIDKNDTIEGAPGLKAEHLPVFDCAFKPAKGTRSIPYMGHVRMMAATQPFISGAISKTVNMPTDATPQDIQECYVAAWRMGLKAIAIYRDGCKRVQPLTTSKEQGEKGKVSQKMEERIVYKPLRRRLADERRSYTHKFSVAGHEGYLIVGTYDDGTPGELFIKMSKEGSSVSGLMDSFAISVSMALQYGVPLKDLCSKYINTRFEPAGVTSNPEIRFAKSLVDYIFKWLALKFLPPEDLTIFGLTAPELHPSKAGATEGRSAGPRNAPAFDKPAQPLTQYLAAPASEVTPNELTKTIQREADAPPCTECGAFMVRYAACYRCLNCGATTGCG